MYIFDRNNLQKFDIILVRFPENEISEKIRSRCNSEYSHAIIYLGNGSFVEGVDPTVSLFSYHRYYFNNLDDVKILRMKNEHLQYFDSEKAEYTLRNLSICNYSNRLLLQIERNRIPENIIYTFKETLKWNGGVVCTTLISLPYYAGGLDISNNNEPYYCNFNHIENSDFFKDITNDAFMETTDVTEDTFDYISCCPTNTILEKQSQIIKTLNDYVENKFRYLQTLNLPLLVASDLEFSHWENVIPVIMKLYMEKEGKEIDNELSELLLNTKYNLLWFEEVHSKKEQFFPIYYYPFNKLSKKDLEFLLNTLEAVHLHISKNEDASFQNFLLCPSKTLHILLGMYHLFEDLLNMSIRQYKSLLENFDEIQ